MERPPQEPVEKPRAATFVIPNYSLEEQAPPVPTVPEREHPPAKPAKLELQA